MSRAGIFIFAAVFVLAGIGAAAGLRLTRGHSETHPGESAAHVAPEAAAFKMQTAPLEDLNGNPTTLAEMHFDGPLVVNFWATWCAPCRAEMPLLDSAAADIGIPILGVAVADQPETIRAFLAEVPVKYDIMTAKFNIFYFFQKNGNTVGALPFTVLLGADGEVLRAKTGEFHSADEFREFAKI